MDTAKTAEGSPLMYNTCDCYLSAMKNFVIRACAAKNIQSELANETAWKDVRWGMVSRLYDRARRMKTRLVNPHEASTDEDLMRIVNVSKTCSIGGVYISKQKLSPLPPSCAWSLLSRL